DAYVSGLGRIPRRLKRGDNIRALRNLVETVERLLNERKKEIAQDPPIEPAILVKDEIEKQVPAIKDILSPTPVTSQLSGLRVKLDYDKYHEEIENVVIDGHKLKEIADVRKSHMYDYILIELATESSLVE
ncbi:MAG: methyl-coenzyme M reductase family protein, partial [Methanobrevibacter sp.]|nr:methyl-coenzyme M reductase family protein [Methanobrevibacter sp.]